MLERLAVLLVVVATQGCTPAEPLPPVTPPAATGALAGVRIAIRCVGPGGAEQPQRCEPFIKAFAAAGVVVVGKGEPHALDVSVDQPLGEWGAAGHCYVTTAKAAAQVASRDVPSNCDQPNVAEHAVAGWLADPAIAAAAAP